MNRKPFDRVDERRRRNRHRVAGRGRRCHAVVAPIGAYAAGVIASLDRDDGDGRFGRDREGRRRGDRDGGLRPGDGLKIGLIASRDAGRTANLRKAAGHNRRRRCLSEGRRCQEKRREGGETEQTHGIAPILWTGKR